MREELRKVVEECAEVQHILCKIDKYGMDNFHPVTKLPNAVVCMGEILQLEEAIKRLKPLIPRPSEEVMVNEVIDMFNNSSLRDREEFVTTAFDNLIVFKSTLGRTIRNAFGLWMYHWEPKMVDGVDMSPEHPDAVSMRVIEEVWRRVKDE